MTERPISELADINPCLTKLPSDTAAVSFVTMADVSESGRLLSHRPRPFGEVKAGFTRFQDGDVLFAKITPCMENGKGAIVFGLEGGIGCGSTEFHVLRVRGNNDPWYLYQWLQWGATRQKAQLFMSGSAGQQRVPAEFFRQFRIPAPEPAAQQRIAAILTSLDNAIEATEALIEKHQQIKAGLMHDLLTRGITRTGQLRPSPEIAPELFRREHDRWVPLDWRDVELQAVADVSRGKFTHRPRNDPRFLGGTHPFIQTGDIAAAAGDYLATYSQTLTDMGASVSSRFPAGTVAVTIAANIADTAILAVPMYFPDSVVGVVVRPVADVRFIELSIRFSKPRLEAMAPQSAQKNINLQDLRPLNLLLPSLEEQRAISQRYEAALYPIKQLQVQREKLRAQKQGLMQDLLTGKVRVPVPNAEAIA